MNWLLIQILRFMGGKLDGYKSLVGACGKIITGVGTIIVAITMGIRLVFPDQVQFPEANIDTVLATFGAGALLISTGIRDIGMAHKMDKQTDAIKAQTTAIVRSVNNNTTEVAVQGIQTVKSIKANTASAVVNASTPCNDNPSGMSQEGIQ